MYLSIPVKRKNLNRSAMNGPGNISAPQRRAGKRHIAAGPAGGGAQQVTGYSFNIDSTGSSRQV